MTPTDSVGSLNAGLLCRSATKPTWQFESHPATRATSTITLCRCSFGASLLRQFERRGNREHCSLPRHTLDSDGTTHSFHEPLRRGEPQSESFVPARK